MKTFSIPIVFLLIFFYTSFGFVYATDPVLQKDRYGRKYTRKKDGSIRLLLEGQYQKIFPYSDQFEIHKSEAILLSDMRKSIDSIRLLKSLLHCEFVEKQVNHSLYFDQSIPAKLNSLLNQYKDNLQEVHLLTEPYGCYWLQEGKLVLSLQSRAIPFSLTLPAEYQYSFSTEKLELEPNHPFILKKFSLFKESQKNEPTDRSFESEIELLENGSTDVNSKTTIRGMQAVFKPGFQMNLHLFKEFTDRKRGISPQFRKNYLQPVSVGKNFGIYQFFVSSESGKLGKKNYRESFSYQKNMGLAFFIYSSEADESEVEKIWTQIKNIE